MTAAPLEMVALERPAAAAGDPDLEWCARTMAGSEPWVTLRRGPADARRILGDPAKEVWLARRDGVRQGFVILAMQGPFTPYLQTICVGPDTRGQGTGSAMLAWVEARAFARAPNLFLCVSSFNVRARRLYERLGFETIGTLRDYVVSGHDEILMRKTTGPLVPIAAPGD